jgi:hypothetical protein
LENAKALYFNCSIWQLFEPQSRYDPIDNLDAIYQRNICWKNKDHNLFQANAPKAFETEHNQSPGNVEKVF